MRVLGEQGSSLCPVFLFKAFCAWGHFPSCPDLILRQPCWLALREGLMPCGGFYLRLHLATLCSVKCFSHSWRLCWVFWPCPLCSMVAPFSSLLSVLFSFSSSMLCHRWKSSSKEVASWVPCCCVTGFFQAFHLGCQPPHNHWSCVDNWVVFPTPLSLHPTPHCCSPRGKNRDGPSFSYKESSPFGFNSLKFI